MLEANWRVVGESAFTSPNPGRYPWQWLWDSCFHAVVWCALDEPDRALRELTSALEVQDDEGFVPHVRYHGDDVHADFWGRRGSSSITQPPMYGHALSELQRAGVTLPGALVERAVRGMRFLFDRRGRDAEGLVLLCHPWESGADDSPRWDDFCPGGFDPSRWFDVKGALVTSIRRSDGGAPVDNPAFPVAGVGWNALVSFNAAELSGVVGDDVLAAEAAALAEALDAHWDGALHTWVDGGPTARSSGRVRTIDALLPVLVTGDARRAEQALALAVDDAAYGGRCGPAGVHRAEPAFAPRAYWRGSSWPQLTYLLWVAASRRRMAAVSSSLASSLRAGATSSGFAEHWDADDGTPLGAIPQSWSTLVVATATAG